MLSKIFFSNDKGVWHGISLNLKTYIIELENNIERIKYYIVYSRRYL